MIQVVIDLQTCIPPLQVENDMIQDDNKKAELFNDYFCKQADLNDSETSVPDITDILINGLEQITVTENEVEDTVHSRTYCDRCPTCPI